MSSVYFRSLTDSYWWLYKLIITLSLKKHFVYFILYQFYKRWRRRREFLEILSSKGLDSESSAASVSFKSFIKLLINIVLQNIKSFEWFETWII